MKDCKNLLNEFKKKETSPVSMPAVIYIESVKGCPYSCAMCSSHFSKPQSISSELLDKIEPYFKNLEVLSIHGQGEPLLGSIPYFVEQSIRHDFVLHMNTTGFFLTREIADLLTRTRLSIRFSIHAGKPVTYKKIMGQNFEKVLENIRYLVRKAKDNKIDSDFWFSFIVMKENLGEIEDFLKLAHDIGIKHVRFMELLPEPESMKGIKMPNRDFTFKYFEQYNPAVEKEFLKRLPRYRELAKTLGISIETGSLESAVKDPHFLEKITNRLTKRFMFGVRLFPLQERRGMCVAPWIGQLIIKINGDVRLCCSLEDSFGNINNSSLREIWNSKKMQMVRASFREGKFPKICEYCRGLKFDEYPKNSYLIKQM
jgi:radical SAM protein with 4Fe4S-binding SPASM domain